MRAKGVGLIFLLVRPRHGVKSSIAASHCGGPRGRRPAGLSAADEAEPRLDLDEAQLDAMMAHYGR